VAQNFWAILFGAYLLYLLLQNRPPIPIFFAPVCALIGGPARRPEGPEGRRRHLGRLPWPWRGKGKVLRVVPLLRAEGSQEDHEVGLGALVDGRPTEADSMVQLAPSILV
jgi:hypothetical protein